MYKPTNYIRNYVEEHGNFEFTDEELDKAFELFYAYFSAVGNDDRPKTNEKEQEFRKSVCMGCSQLVSEDGHNHCNLCGCNIDFKIKEPGESCPEFKWPPDLKTLKQTVKNTADYLNSQVTTGFYTQPTVEEIKFKYRKIVEEGTKHE